MGTSSPICGVNIKKYLKPPVGEMKLHRLILFFHERRTVPSWLAVGLQEDIFDFSIFGELIHQDIPEKNKS